MARNPVPSRAGGSGLTLEAETHRKIDAAIVGHRAGATSRTAAAEPGVHAGRLAELRRRKRTLVAAGVEMVQNVRKRRAHLDAVAPVGGCAAATTAASAAAPHSHSAAATPTTTAAGTRS